MREAHTQHNDDEAGHGGRRYRQSRRRPKWAQPPVPDAPQERGEDAPLHTDLFGFSAAEVCHVVLRLGPLSTRILMEEYGVPDSQLVIDTAPGRRLFATSVCSLEGVGRFVLGLISDIEVVKGDALRQWLLRQLREGLRRLSP